MKLKQISGLGTAAGHNTGVSAGCVVQLGTDGALPSVDGSLLVNLSTSGGGETSIPLINLVTVSGGQDYTVPNSTPSGSLIVQLTLSDTINTNIYLPPASNYAEGEYITIGRNGGSKLTYVRLATGETWVNTAGTYQAINSHDSLMLVSDGSSKWFKLFGAGLT